MNIELFVPRLVRRVGWSIISVYMKSENSILFLYIVQQLLVSLMPKMMDLTCLEWQKMLGINYTHFGFT